MKKAITILLAACLALGLVTPVHAAESANRYGLALVDWGDYPFEDGLALEERDLLFGYAEGKVDPDYAQSFEALTPGTTIYLPAELFTKDSSFAGVEEQDSGAYTVASTDALSHYTVSTQVAYGRLTLDSAELVTATDVSTGEERPYLAIHTKDNYSLGEQNVGLTITIQAKDGACIWTGDEYVSNGSLSLELDFTTLYGITYARETTEVDPDYPVVDFDEVELEDITLSFGGGVTFAVNVLDQSSLFLRYNTQENAEVTAANAGASMSFITFEGTRKTFRNTGTLTLPVPEGAGSNPKLYKISLTGRLTELDATFDASDRTFTLDTKSLDQYVIADRELNAAVNSMPTAVTFLQS